MVPGRSRKKVGELESRLDEAGQREGMSSASPRVSGERISMSISKQSKVPAIVAACGVLLAGFLVCSSDLRAGQVPATTQQGGQTVYVNASPSPPASDYIQPGQLLLQIDSIINRVSARYQVDPRLIHAMIRVESDYDPTAVSSKGAMGLMQLIPSTAARFGVEDPFNPRQNIQGGVSYLKYLMDLFGGNLPLSLAAYNAGEETVIRSGGIPPIPETEHYVRAVTSLYHSNSANSGPPAGEQDNRIQPIVRYVDSEGVIHFTNAE